MRGKGKVGSRKQSREVLSARVSCGTINVGWESEVVRGAWRVVDVGPRDILYLDYGNLASVPMIFFRDSLVAELGWPHYTGVDPATWFVVVHSWSIMSSFCFFRSCYLLLLAFSSWSI
jgi:hypothetical protein